jgi:hypothetical protein
MHVSLADSDWHCVACCLLLARSTGKTVEASAQTGAEDNK